jgi:uncharacterized membrane protein
MALITIIRGRGILLIKITCRSNNNSMAVIVIVIVIIVITIIIMNLSKLYWTAGKEMGDIPLTGVG